MFGYVKVDSSELKVKEYELYRAVYCGLCRSMGKCTGQCSRMTLNYDFVFLSLFRMALSPTEAPLEIKKRRCLAHPFRKRSVMERNPQLDFSADAAAILFYHKIRDDISDEKGFSKLRSLLLLPFAAHSRKKAIRRGFSSLDQRVASLLEALSELERSAPKSVDAPAEIFGELLGEICSFGKEGFEARIARDAGLYLGKWIYITDALDDMERDKKRGRYNPFLLLYDGSIPNKDSLDDISLALRNQLYGLENAVDLIDPEGKEPIMNIIKNAIYLGLPATVEKIADRYSDNINKC